MKKLLAIAAFGSVLASMSFAAPWHHHHRYHHYHHYHHHHRALIHIRL